MKFCASKVHFPMLYGGLVQWESGKGKNHFVIYIEITGYICIGLYTFLC